MLNKEKTMKSKHIVMALAALSFSALAAAQIVDENPKDEQHSAQKQPAARKGAHTARALCSKR